jgi:prolipoprotein diacylglyceryltransferase
MCPALYPWVILLAIVASALLSRRYPSRLSTRDRLLVGFGAFTGAMIGAKLPFVLSDWEGLVSGGAWFSSGKTILAGLVGGYLGVELAKMAGGIQAKTGDGFAVPVAVAVAIGRLGCFCAGCCYGAPTVQSWGLDFGDGIRRHPAQLYEFGFHLAAAVLLELLYRRRLLQGQLIKLYIMLYLVFRFVSEVWRPEARFWLDLTLYQWAALLLLPIFALLWVRDEKAKREGRLQWATT